MELDPKRADLHAARGRALRVADNRSEAKLEFRRALELDPSSKEAELGLLSLRSEPRHEMRVGVNTDLFSFVGPNDLEGLSFTSHWTPRWKTSVSVLSHSFLLQFVIFGYAFATVISIGSVLQEELTYKRYNDWQDVARLVSYCFLEHFPYRQLHMIWRLQGASGSICEATWPGDR